MFGAERLLVLCIEGPGCGCAIFSRVSLVGTEIPAYLCSYCAAVSSAPSQLASLALPRPFCASSLCFHYLHIHMWVSEPGWGWMPFLSCSSGSACLLPPVWKQELLEWLLWHWRAGSGTAPVWLDLLWMEGSRPGWRLRASPSPWLASCTERSRLSLWLRQELLCSACGHVVFPAPLLFPPGQGPRRSVPMAGLGRT